MNKQTTRRIDAAVYNPTDKSPLRRRANLIDGAIIYAALDLHAETDTLVPFGDHTMAVWNCHADMIDAKFGRGFLGVRIERINAFTFRFQIIQPRQRGLFVPLRGRNVPGVAGVPIVVWRAIGMLDDLATKSLIFLEAQPGVFAWMADVLFMSIIPGGLILREAGPRNSVWDRRLRKRESVKAQRRAIAYAEQLAELEQDQQRQSVRIYRADLLRRHRVLDRMIRLGRRLDPDLKDVAAGWPHGWRVLRTGDSPGNLGMLVPLSWSMAQNAEAFDLPAGRYVSFDELEKAEDDINALGGDDQATE
jgi:hypothetical protein